MCKSEVELRMGNVSIRESIKLARNTYAWNLSLYLIFLLAADLCGQQAPITSACFLPSGQLATGSDEGLHIHDGKSLARTKRIETRIEKIYSIRVAPNGTRFAIAGGTPAELGQVEVYSVKNFNRTNRFGLFDDVATDVVWASNEKLVACSMTGDCCLMSLDPANKQRHRPFNVHSKGILGIDALKTGELVTGGLDNTIGVWKLDETQVIRVLNNHVDVVNQLALRPSGDKSGPALIVSVSDDATVRFWQPAIGRMVRFARLNSIPTCVVWNQAGTLAIVGTRNGQLNLVDPETAKSSQVEPAKGWINCLALSPDEASIIVGGEFGLERIPFASQ